MMATYFRREIHTTRVEFVVPAPWPAGACWVEVQKAISAAMQEMVGAGMLADGATPADDAIWIRPGDEDVVVAFERSTALADDNGGVS